MKSRTTTAVTIVVIVATLLLAGYFLRGRTAPAPVPWNTSAIVATYETLAIEEVDNVKIAIFSYKIENRTGKNYAAFVDNVKVKLYVKYRHNSTIKPHDDYIRALDALDIPAHGSQKMRIGFGYDVSGWIGGKKDVTSADTVKRVEAGLKEFNVGGFALFDEATGYEIEFPFE